MILNLARFDSSWNVLTLDCNNSFGEAVPEFKFDLDSNRRGNFLGVEGRASREGDEVGREREWGGWAKKAVIRSFVLRKNQFLLHFQRNYLQKPDE